MRWIIRPSQELASAFRRFDADESLSVAILTGVGGYFCAGADLKAVATGKGNRVTADGDGPLGCTRMLLSKPVIAAVEGYAVAGGLELALWCDMRVAARDAVFGVFCRRFGVPLIDGGTVRLPQPHRHEQRDGHDPHRARRFRRRGAADGPRESHRRAWQCARIGERTRAPDRRVSAALHARRSDVGLRGVDDAARRRDPATNIATASRRCSRARLARARRGSASGVGRHGKF